MKYGEREREKVIRFDDFTYCLNNYNIIFANHLCRLHSMYKFSVLITGRESRAINSASPTLATADDTRNTKNPDFAFTHGKRFDKANYFWPYCVPLDSIFSFRTVYKTRDEQNNNRTIGVLIHVFIDTTNDRAIHNILLGTSKTFVFRPQKPSREDFARSLYSTKYILCR